MAKTKKTTTEARRGSEKLLEQLQSPTVFAAKDLRKLASIRESADLRVLDWRQYGQPVPDAFQASFELKPAAAGRLLSSLLKLESLRVNLDVFPEGIPVIDRVRVNVRAGR